MRNLPWIVGVTSVKRWKVDEALIWLALTVAARDFLTVKELLTTACQEMENQHDRKYIQTARLHLWNERCAYRVCQMLSQSINIWDIDTKVGSLCSLYHVPSYESNLILLAWFMPDFAYFSMLFNTEMVCTAGSADDLKNK